VKIRPDEAPVWHPDVRFFRIEDDAGALRAQFYLDLYAREGKRGGAWMDDARSRHLRSDGTVQTPVAYLTCNFSAPVGGKSACFTHDEVITLQGRADTYPKRRALAA
jgi:oligopeptidase A